MEPDPTLRQRTRERMAALGIPAGTDTPKLLALGAKPLPGEPMNEAREIIARAANLSSREVDAILAALDEAGFYIGTKNKPCRACMRAGCSLPTVVIDGRTWHDLREIERLYRESGENR